MPPRVIEDVATRRGMTVLSRSRMAAVRRAGDGVRVELTDGSVVEGSHCLLALGSVPNTAGIGLEEAGVDLDKGGFVQVDRVSRTTGRGVYAAGDCTGVLMLASVAGMQGRIAMWHALGDAVHPLDLAEVSSNVFTAPEIATVGWTQRQVDEGDVDASVVVLELNGNARAKMQGVRDGFVKLFCRSGHRDRLRRRRRGAAGQRADPRRRGRRRVPSHRRPDGARIHGLPVDDRFHRRGGTETARSLRNRPPFRILGIPHRITPVYLLADSR